MHQPVVVVQDPRDVARRRHVEHLVHQAPGVDGAEEGDGSSGMSGGGSSSSGTAAGAENCASGAIVEVDIGSPRRLPLLHGDERP